MTFCGASFQKLSATAGQTISGSNSERSRNRVSGISVNPSCLRGEENICVGGPRQLGCSNGCPGGYATHVMVPDPKYLIDYGKTDPALGAAYMCSGVTAYAAMKKIGHLGPDDQVLVLGVGGVGMMGVQFAKAMFGKGPLAADISNAVVRLVRVSQEIRACSPVT